MKANRISHVKAKQLLVLMLEIVLLCCESGSSRFQSLLKHIMYFSTALREKFGGPRSLMERTIFFYFLQLLEIFQEKKRILV